VKFKKEDLRKVAFGGTVDGMKLVHGPELIDTSRWRHHHEAVFSFDGHLYSVYYTTGATECQDEAPFEYEPNEIECQEVVPEERTITVYVPVKE